MNRVNRYKRIKADLAKFWSQGWIIGPSRHAVDNESYVAIMRAGETPEKVADEASELLNRLHNVDLPWLLAEFENVNDMLSSFIVNTDPLTESHVEYGKKLARGLPVTPPPPGSGCWTIEDPEVSTPDPTNSTQ